MSQSGLLKGIWENRLVFTAGLDLQDFLEEQMFYKIAHTKKSLNRLQWKPWMGDNEDLSIAYGGLRVMFQLFQPRC